MLYDSPALDRCLATSLLNIARALFLSPLRELKTSVSGQERASRELKPQAVSARCALARA
jgi:hypothetical protein